MFPFTLDPEAAVWLRLTATIVLSATAVVVVLWLTGAVRFIPNSRVGIVEKLWSSRGSLGT